MSYSVAERNREQRVGESGPGHGKAGIGEDRPFEQARALGQARRDAHVS